MSFELCQEKLPRCLLALVTLQVLMLVIQLGKKQTNKKTYDFSSLGNLEGHSNNIK